MAFTDWQDGQAGGTPLSAARLNAMGTGINAAQSAADAAQTTADTKVTGDGISVVRSITQAAYDALATKDPATLYVIVG